MELIPDSPADEHSIRAALADPLRLAALFDTGLLDSPPEESFDRLTRLASKLTGAPVAFVSLVDTDRDFYISAWGLSEPLKTQRQISGRTFCHHALVAQGPLVLEDASVLPVFCDVPTVKSFGVRAYAGIPLKSDDGKVLGSFCAVDFQPKHWSEQDVEVLVELAHAAMREVRLRKALRNAQVLNHTLVDQVQKAFEMNEKLQELATTDALTGLRNRRAFEQSLEQQLAIVERRKSPLSLLMLDVDHFKQINDSFGHEAGDKVLLTIAHILGGCARVVDMVSRIGGEEFAVILPDTDTAGALEVAQRMRNAVAQAGWLVHPTTISIGVATLGPNELARSLRLRADAALYAAKNSGRNCVVVAASA